MGLASSGEMRASLGHIQETDPVISYHFETNFPDKRRLYYLSTLDPRFDFADTILSKRLEALYGQGVEPIQILSNRLASGPRFSNHVLINGELKRRALPQEYIWLPEHEELNEEMSGSPFIAGLLEDLQHQDQVFINAFTTSFSSLPSQIAVPIGPRPDLATLLDSKVEQQGLFDRLGLAPSGTIARSLEELRRIVEANPSARWFVAVEYSSGGCESSVIDGSSGLAGFARKIRARDLGHRFVISEYLPHEDSQNSTAIVLDDEHVFVASVSDQLFLDDPLAGVEYVGNIYPSRRSPQVRARITEATRRIGGELARLGYRGMFGVDFVVTEDRVFAVDLNPRRQGGYLSNVLMFESLQDQGFPSLVDLELQAFIGRGTARSLSRRYENPELGFAWAHSKIPPVGFQPTIDTEIGGGAATECFRRPGRRFFKSFYPRGSTYLGGDMVGSVVVSGRDWAALLHETRWFAELLSTRICRAAARAT